MWYQNSLQINPRQATKFQRREGLVPRKLEGLHIKVLYNWVDWHKLAEMMGLGYNASVAERHPAMKYTLS